MKDTAIIILNYKNYRMTLDIISELNARFYKERFDVVVVDNNSPDDSAAGLKSYNDENGKPFELILSDENRGYAAGNNIGIRWAHSHGYKYAWVLNNDLIFADNSILDKMCDLLAAQPELAAVSPRIIDCGSGRELNRNVKRTTVWSATFGRAFWVIKQKYKLEKHPKEKWRYVYRPQGCCMLLRCSAMADIDYMDERTFLYNEEEILAERLLRKNYRCACLLDGSIVHNHGATVSTSIDRERVRRIQQQSRKIYYEYVGYSPLKIKMFELIDSFENSLLQRRAK